MVVVLFPSSAHADDRVRVEKRDPDQFEFASAMSTITEFYSNKSKGLFASQTPFITEPAVSDVLPQRQR